MEHKCFKVLARIQRVLVAIKMIVHQRSYLGIFVPNPFCQRRGAQGVGWQLHRRVQLLHQLIHRVCLTEARSAKGVSRCSPRPSTAGCPKRSATKRRDAGIRGSFFAFLFGCSKRKVARRGDIPASARKRRHQRSIKQKAQTTTLIPTFSRMRKKELIVEKSRILELRKLQI